MPKFVLMPAVDCMLEGARLTSAGTTQDASADPVHCKHNVPAMHNACILENHSLVCGRRSEYKPDALRWPDVEGEALTGKQFILPATDVKGHPVLVLRPR